MKRKLADLQCERLAVMDELCEYLSEIPPADISSFFKPGAAFVQRRLALRYNLMTLLHVHVYKVSNNTVDNNIVSTTLTMYFLAFLCCGEG